MDRWVGEPAFDGLIGTNAIVESHPTPVAKRVRDRISSQVDLDGGHPLRRLVDPTFPIPREVAHSDATRPTINRVLIEVAACNEHGLRPVTASWICGAMRDDGGYGTTHALWAAVIARNNGCAPVTCLDDLVAELATSQPAAPGPATLEADLFAERILMRRLAGAFVAGTEFEALRHAQTAEGRFGVSPAGEPPWHAFHAAMTATWALLLESETNLPAQVRP